MPKLVIIESPYRGDNYQHTDENTWYLHQCIHDCFRRGEVPFASHGFYTKYLDDKNPEERKQGIEAGYEIMRRADLVVFYIDRGISEGMLKAMHRVAALEMKYEIRRLG